eukprot:Rmarinus@m.16176
MSADTGLGRVLRCKLLLMGDATVGKTALTQLFLSGGSHFQKRYVMTVEADLSMKKVSVPGTNVFVELYIHDIGGNELFRDQVESYCGDAAVVLFAYDVTNRESFEQLGLWVELVRRVHSDGLPFIGIVVANKVDLTGRSVVEAEEGAEFARSQGFEFFQTSALEHHESDTPFTFAAKSFYEAYQHALDRLEKLVL